MMIVELLTSLPASCFSVFAEQTSIHRNFKNGVLTFSGKGPMRDVVDPGDINGDGTIEAFNYQMVKAHVLGTYRI